MTSVGVRPHVAQVLKRTHAILLPFDGTLCDLFAGVDTAAITEKIHGRLSSAGHAMSLLTSIVTDPLWMMAYAYNVGHAYGIEAEKVVRDAETAAATTAMPARGAHGVLRACKAGGRPVAIVGDTCSAAMETYLDRHGLRHLVGPVIGRERRRTSSETPEIDLVERAVKALGKKPSDCALVSLSFGGMCVAAEAGTQAIGVVNERGSRKHLATISGSVVVSSLPYLAGALTAVPVTNSR